MMESSWLSFLLGQVWRLPHLLIAGAGIILALARWRHHPQVSMVALLAFVLSIANQLLWVGFSFWQQLGHSVSGHILVFQVVGLLLYIPSQVFILLAIFGWRAAPNSIRH